MEILWLKAFTEMLNIPRKEFKVCNLDDIKSLLLSVLCFDLIDLIKDSFCFLLQNFFTFF